MLILHVAPFTPGLSQWLSLVPTATKSSIAYLHRKGSWSNFIADNEQGDEYQKVLIFIAQVLCPTRELSFMSEMIMSKKMERWSMLKVILVYISITRNHIFLCFENCYEKKSVQKQNIWRVKKNYQRFADGKKRKYRKSMYTFL